MRTVHNARPLIARLRAEGLGPTAIARRFTADGVPTPSGRGQWTHSQVIRHADPTKWRTYMRGYRARLRGDPTP